MTSRPASAKQPSQQQSAARPPAPAGRGPSQVSSGGNHARPPGLSVFLSARGSQSSNRTGGSERPSPTSSALGSPNRLASGQRGGNYNGSSRGALTPSGIGRSRVDFPPRPGQYTEQISRERPTGVPNYTKADSRALSFDPPAVSLIYPHGSQLNTSFEGTIHTNGNHRKYRLQSMDGQSNRRQPH